MKSPMPPPRLAPRTLREYEGVLKVGLKRGKLDSKRVETWSASRRTVLRAALRWRGISGIEVPRAPRRPRRDLPIPAELELERIERAAAELPRGVRVLVLLPLALGLRAGEVLGLERRAVRRAVETGELILKRKGSYEARLPTSHATKLFEELLACPARAGGKWERAGQVVSPSGGPHTQYVALRRLARAVGRRAGVRGLRPHLLRHAFASRMLNDGAPITVVQRWLGHADLRTTMRYLHPTPEAMLEHLPRARFALDW